MKQVLAATSVMLLCCYSTLLNAQQTYIRNYSTHTEYITVPAATVPSSYKSFTVPTYTYDKPVTKEAEEREETPEDRMRDRFSGISSAYQQKNYDEMISLSYGFDPSVLERYYGRESFYGMLINSYINLNRKKELVDYFLNAETDVVLFSEPAFGLIVADELRAADHFREACTYFDKAKARGVYNKKYQLSYCITMAEVEGREQEAREAFDILIQNDPEATMLNYYYRGKFLMQQNDASAISDLNYFIEIVAEKYDAYLLRARAHFKNQNYKQCIADAKEYKKNHVCSECDELIAKASIAFEEQKINPVYIAEQKIVEAQAAEEKKRRETELANQQIWEAEKKKKEDRELEALKKLDDEYRAYLKQHNITELVNEYNKPTGKFDNYYDAIQQGDLKSVYLLWKQGNDINAPYKYSRYTLFDAIDYSEFHIAEFLIINNFNLNTKSSSNTLLHAACKNSTTGALKIAKILIEKGADVNAIGDFGYTPLHHAASDGDLELAKLLLDNGAKTNIKNSEHRTPAGVARFYGKDEMINFLKKYEAK